MGSQCSKRGTDALTGGGNRRADGEHLAGNARCHPDGFAHGNDPAERFVDAHRTDLAAVEFLDERADDTLDTHEEQ